MSNKKLFTASFLLEIICLVLTSSTFAQLDPDFGTNGISTAVTAGGRLVVR